MALMFDEYAAQHSKLCAVEENSTLDADTRDDPLFHGDCTHAPDDTSENPAAHSRAPGDASVTPNTAENPTESWPDENWIGRCVAQKFGAAWYTGHVLKRAPDENADTSDAIFIVSYCINC